MKAIVSGALLALVVGAFLSGPADAAGCLNGAVVGGVAFGVLAFWLASRHRVVK